MKTKVFLFLGLLFGLLLLISSVTATETPQDLEKIDEEKEPNQWGQGGRSCKGQGGCCHWSREGYGCVQCCHSAASESNHEVNGGGWSGGYGGAAYGGRGGGWGGGRGGGWGGRGGERGCRWPGC